MPDPDLKARVAAALAAEIGPALELDGAAIEVVGVEKGVARLRLGPVCASCPATVVAIMRGIEDELRQRVPEVRFVEVVP
jgi:Fe-S cluster biogenesis protein NfuA